MEDKFFRSKKLTREYQGMLVPELRLLNIMVARRSYRKFYKWSADKRLISELDGFVKKSSTVRGCSEDAYELVSDESLLIDLLKSAYRGVIGKVNPWLPKTRPAGAYFITLDKSIRDMDKPIEYAYPSMVGEDLQLWITEKGLGSIWLAGVNGDELARKLDLPGDNGCQLWLCLVRPIENQKVNIDKIVYYQTSRKRKSFN